jgi:glyoxylase-like metal-dependent hydrolase (beta-lactamase superfamily II)/poly(3-hydroxybutyrate) depolymerase
MEKKVLRKLISILSVLLIALTIISCAAKSENTVKNINADAAKLAPLFKSDNFQEMPYRYFEPAMSENSKYPVILYLHGETEAGTDNEAQVTVTEGATNWVAPDYLAINPTFVIAPQIPVGSDWTKEPVYSKTLALLNRFIESHPQIDKTRIYIVGFSMGGTGVWNIILKNPKLFAAAMPISGNADKWLGNNDAWAALKNLPVIVIHSNDDQIAPVSGSLNAVAALQASGNIFVSGSTHVCLWNAGSTVSPHDAWYTAFHKFDVIYNELFEQNLERTNFGEISPVMLYTRKDLGNGITRIWDHGLNTATLIERTDKAILVDCTLGKGNILQFIKENVLKNKDIDIEIFITHNDNDHIYGLNHFLGASQLKKIYVHKYDADLVINLLGKDASKVVIVKDGDQIPFGAKNAETIWVPGHSRGHTIMKYENYLFPGDAIGTGYIGCGDLTVEEYIQSLQHLLDVMGDENYTILAGHTGECRKPMTNEYVHQLLALAKGIVDGSIKSSPYWRNLRQVATLGDANITFDLNNIHTIKGGLFNLNISEGKLTPAFAKYLSYYSATVDANVSSIEITPDVLAEDFKSLTINGEPVISRGAYKVNLVNGKNQFSIETTSSDDTKKVYTLTVTRGI